MSTIAENIQTLFDIKTSIKESINAKGGTITDSTPYADYATAIDNLPSGGGDIVIGDDEPLTFVLVEGGGDDGVGLIKYYSPNTTGFQYRIDDGEWQDYTVDTYVPITKGHKLQFLQFQNTTRDYVSTSGNYLQFKTKGIYRCGGNVMSLCNYATTITQSYCFNSLFQNTSIITTPCLPATTLAEYCYQYMFNGCTSLVNAPELPATTLANYCYYYMFQGCTSLVNTPSVLLATELGSYCCNYMFRGCTSLVNAPELPATTLADDCYYGMFYGCSSLVNAPSVLPATTLASSCYSYMFYNCSSLVNAPELPATTLNTDYCYNNMFRGCASLKHIKAMFTTTPSSTYTNNWLTNAKNTSVCVFEYNPEAEWVNSFTRGTSTVPSNWQMIPASV